MKYSLVIFLAILWSSALLGTTGTKILNETIPANPSWAFEENRGQLTGKDSKKINYFYKSGNMTMFLMKQGIAYQFEKMHYPEGYQSPHTSGWDT